LSDLVYCVAYHFYYLVIICAMLEKWGNTWFVEQLFEHTNWHKLKFQIIPVQKKIIWSSPSWWSLSALVWESWVWSTLDVYTNAVCTQLPQICAAYSYILHKIISSIRTKVW